LSTLSGGELVDIRESAAQGFVNETHGRQRVDATVAETLGPGGVEVRILVQGIGGIDLEDRVVNIVTGTRGSTTEGGSPQ
jgi:hypothetical protein